MKITLHGFGAARALSGYTLEVNSAKSSIAIIRQQLFEELKTKPTYADLLDILPTTVFASDNEVLAEDYVISTNIQLNLLPPVCGG